MLTRSFIGSATLHATIILAASLAWPHSFDIPEDESPVLPVELVTVADETNIAPTIEKPPEPEAPAPPPVEARAPEPPPPVEVAPSEPDQKPPPPPKEETKVATAPPPPPLPRRKPVPDPKQQFNVDSVLALLDKRAPPKPAAPKDPAPIAPRTVQGIGDRNLQTVDIKDALLAQMRECWNVPVGAPNPEQLIVQVRVFLAQDGSLAQPPQLEPQSRTAAASNPYMRTAAEAAIRAVSVCEPYRQLPVEKYEAWREIVMTFDPSKMIR